MTETDLVAIAQHMLKQLGDEAMAIAAERAVANRNDGDMEAAAVWEGVAEAIRLLQTLRKPN